MMGPGVGNVANWMQRRQCGMSAATLAASSIDSISGRKYPSGKNTSRRPVRCRQPEARCLNKCDCYSRRRSGRCCSDVSHRLATRVSRHRPASVSDSWDWLAGGVTEDGPITLGGKHMWCSRCRPRFTRRSGSAFSGRSFADEVISLAVPWYVRSRLAYTEPSSMRGRVIDLGDYAFAGDGVGILFTPRVGGREQLRGGRGAVSISR